jgi:hypothetical protein
MKTDAAFRQPKYSFDFSLTGSYRGVAPKVKLAASWKLFLRGFSSHQAVR